MNKDKCDINKDCKLFGEKTYCYNSYCKCYKSMKFDGNKCSNS